MIIEIPRPFWVGINMLIRNEGFKSLENALAEKDCWVVAWVDRLKSIYLQC